MRKKVNKKLIVALLSFVLLFGGTFGSSLAWLLDSTEDVQNTFTTSNITIDLKEDGATEGADGVFTQEFQMVPGHAIDKKPEVMVATDSEECYLFVEISVPEGSGYTITKNTDGTYNLGKYLYYAIDSSWTPLENVDNVFYMVIDEAEMNKYYSILGAGEIEFEGDTYSWNDNQVLTKPTVTKDDMLEIGANNKPTLTFKAYAVQLWRTNESADDKTTTNVNEAQFTPAEAWAKCPTT